MAKVRPTIIKDIVEEHADEVASLWMLRDQAVVAPHYDLAELAELDRRVDANLSGLRLGGSSAWNFCSAALTLDDPGTTFTAAMLAFESRNPAWIGSLLSYVRSSPGTVRGVISALGWLEDAQFRSVAVDLFNARSSFQSLLGIAGHSVRRVNAGFLGKAIGTSDGALRARALRAAGALGRIDLAREMAGAMRANDEDERFWAAWAACLLGERAQSPGVLRAVVQTESPYRERALQLLPRVMEPAMVKRWIPELANGAPDGLRLALVSLGRFGDPAAVNSLIRHMQNPALARVAGEAFTLITGVGLDDAGLEDEEAAALMEESEEELEVDDIGMDPDEDLPWPNVPLLAQWWAEHRGRFQSGRRHLMGAPITPEQCKSVLLTGRQRQRAAAALELALLEPAAPLFETRAPGKVQQQLLDTTNIVN